MRVQRNLSVTVPIPPEIPPGVVIATLQTVSPVIRNLGTLSHYEETPEGGEPVASDAFFYGPSSPKPQQSPPAPSSSGASSPPTPPSATTTPAAVSSYQIYELITLAPGLTKQVTYPAYFQRVTNGIRVRANGAAGITGWCEFTVRPSTSSSTAGATAGQPSPAASNPSPVSQSTAHTNTDSEAASPEYTTPEAFAEALSPSTYATPADPSAPQTYEVHEAIVVEANSLLMPFVCHTMQIAHRGLCNKVIQEAADNLLFFQGQGQQIPSSFSQSYYPQA